MNGRGSASGVVLVVGAVVVVLLIVGILVAHAVSTFFSGWLP